MKQVYGYGDDMQIRCLSGCDAKLDKRFCWHKNSGCITGWCGAVRNELQACA